jgi:hypothetical protein
MDEFAKSCILCLRTLDIRYFNKCSKSRDGHGSYCKKCTRAYNRYKKEQEYKLAGKTFRQKKIVFKTAPAPESSFQQQISFPEPEFEQVFV